MSEIVDAACAIRGYLPELLGSAAAAELDAALATLLSADHPDEDGLLEQFDRYDTTRDWAAAFFQFHAPPELVQLGERGFSEAPGYGDDVHVPKFVCPHGDFAWYRHAVGETLPRCPTHGTDVEPADA